MTDRLRALVVDDEPAARDKLSMMLNQAGRFDTVGVAGDGLQALRLIDDRRPDVVFLDIQMPELDGLSVAAALDPETGPAVIFVTAFDQHALKAFELHAVDYLLKPFDQDRLQQTLDRIEAVMRAPQLGRLPQLLKYYRSGGAYPERIAFRTEQGLRIVDHAQIEWLESHGNYVKVCLHDDAFITRQTLTSLLSQLPPDQFIQIHRSHVINISRVEEVRPLGRGDYSIKLADGVALRLSRSFKQEFFAALPT